MSLGRVSVAFRRLDPYAIEGFTSLCSAWSAKCLLSNGHVFETTKDYYWLLKDLDTSQANWARFCIVACFLEALGVLLTVFPKSFERKEVGFFLRLAGLSMSAIFWGIVGLSFVLANTDAIPSLPMLMVGCTAFWCIVRSPKMPGDESD